MSKKKTYEQPLNEPIPYVWAFKGVVLIFIIIIFILFFIPNNEECINMSFLKRIHMIPQLLYEREQNVPEKYRNVGSIEEFYTNIKQVPLPNGMRWNKGILIDKKLKI